MLAPNSAGNSNGYRLIVSRRRRPPCSCRRHRAWRCRRVDVAPCRTAVDPSLTAGPAAPACIAPPERGPQTPTLDAAQQSRRKVAKTAAPVDTFTSVGGMPRDFRMLILCQAPTLRCAPTNVGRPCHEICQRTCYPACIHLKRLANKWPSALVINNALNLPSHLQTSVELRSRTPAVQRRTSTGDGWIEVEPARWTRHYSWALWPRHFRRKTFLRSQRRCHILRLVEAREVVRLLTSALCWPSGTAWSVDSPCGGQHWLAHGTTAPIDRHRRG